MYKFQTVSAIIVAAGRGERMGGIDKIFAPLAGISVLERVTGVFNSSPFIDHFVVVIARENEEQARHLLDKKHFNKLTEVVPGGLRRQDSVESGLKNLGSSEWVLIHDGARPLLGPELIENGLEAARETGAAAAAIPVTDTIKLVDDLRYVKETLPRSRLWAVQTPQIFRSDIIDRAYRGTAADVTDDAALVEAMGIQVKIYMGAYSNIKITTPADLALAEILCRQREG
jgi:2-C-methyl-D-erythritol 4-phosphate cytidylyltransferase